nr:hypothetical protein [Tanacetum cinerariifolium]
MLGSDGGWLAKCSIESNDGRGGGGLVVRGGEVNGRGVVLGVFKSLLSEIPKDVMGESGGETMRLDGGAIWLNLEGKTDTYSASVVEMARAVCFLDNHE